MMQVWRRRNLSDFEHRSPLLDKRPAKLPLVNRRGGLNVETCGLPKTFLYWGDMFHTLVNMPNFRFSIVLLITYFLLFVAFAVPFYYDAYHNQCIPGVHSFSHALWFSVQTSMTIGYGGDLTPDPNCTATNILVITQSFASLIIAYSLLGVFYARFARPTRRAQTLIFSKNMVLYEEDGVSVLAFRMANIRKHQIIEANVRLLVGLNNTLNEDDERSFNFTSVPVLGGGQVFLGLPCTVKHPITSSSLLFGLSLKEMEQADVEILVLLEGVDSSTSSKLQARQSYQPSDICKGFRFETMVTRLPDGRRCVDFTKFDSMVLVTEPMVTRPSCFSSSASLPFVRHFSGSSPEDTENDSNLLGRDQFGKFHSFHGNVLYESAISPLYNKISEGSGCGWLSMPDLSINALQASSTLKNYPLRRIQEGPSMQTNPTNIFGDPQNPPVRRKSKSLPDLFKLEHSALHEKEEFDLKISTAETASQLWKNMLIELAFKVQQTLQQPSIAADADAGLLIASAKQCLSNALLSS